MALPSYQELMNPVLEIVAERGEIELMDLMKALADRLHLTNEDKNTRGLRGDSIFTSRVAWTQTYLKKAGLLIYARGKKRQITEEGRRILSQKIVLNRQSLVDLYPHLRKFYNSRGEKQKDGLSIPTPPANESTPQEKLEDAFEELRMAIQDELIERIIEADKQDNNFFERMIGKLFKAIYPGSEYTTTSPSRDGGIDGILHQDPLHLDPVVFQAKRYDPQNKIGSPKVQELAGAMQENKVSKGIFVTTSGFSDSAKASAEKLSIRLVDGNRLTRLMLQYGVGVRKVQEYPVFNLDENFFSEEG